MPGGGDKLGFDIARQSFLPGFGVEIPFSFGYDGGFSRDLLPDWKADRRYLRLDSSRESDSYTWTDTASGLRVTCDFVRYSDYPAVDWVLSFENTGTQDTPIIENIQAMDLVLPQPHAGMPFRVHSLRGGVCNPTQYEPAVTQVRDGESFLLCADNGRPSTVNTPFFKIEAGDRSVVAAIEWSGCWTCLFECKDGSLCVRSGMEKTHFRLHPGEKVRSPRMLLLSWDGDTLESNAQFRQLIYKHYAPKRSGKPSLPVPFCNSCFTRGGGWLNECNAANQISLIEAYGELGIEGFVTDAGWFTGGWPDGAGNWDARKDAYPDGMAPVAKAAAAQGMIYGLWFEPERVISGTDVHRRHPEWCLASQDQPEKTYLLNFGLPEVQDYFFEIVKGYMDMPGFKFYRQDFNMNPLPYWRYSDAPDRQGITEMRYVEGLYAYWDRIRQTWPDCLMEGCASGGHRVELGTIKRMDFHQKSDLWFRDDCDQASLWALSQYVPSNVIVAHLNNLDEYSFHSTLASSLCLGWIADAPGFDMARGRHLLKRYRELRHLLIGAWYPLLPYPRNLVGVESSGLAMGVWDESEHPNNAREHTGWVASQYHRPDLDEGLLLCFRQSDSPYSSAEVSLHGLDPAATYQLEYDCSGKVAKAAGGELMKSMTITLPSKRASDIIIYRKVD